MLSIFRLAAFFLLLFAPIRTAHSQDYNSLLVYGVAINRTPVQSWGPGSGIYLGNGLVLTAAHVVGRAFWTRPKVVVFGQEFETSVIRSGSFEEIDLTLLKIDALKLPQRLALRRAPICENQSTPGQEVATVSHDKITFSKVVSPERLPLQLRRFATVIGDVATTGNSGSGVFDLKRKCLMGIMSRKISTRMPGSEKLRDIAKYFVPASEIRAFIPAQN